MFNEKTAFGICARRVTRSTGRPFFPTGRQLSESSQMAALWATYSFHSHFLETHKGHVVGQKRGLTQQNVLFFPSAFSTHLAPISFKTENDLKKKKKKHKRKKVWPCLFIFVRGEHEKEQPDRLRTQTIESVNKLAGASPTDELEVTCVSNRCCQKPLRNIESNWQPSPTALEKKRKKNKRKKKLFFQIKIWQLRHKRVTK